MDGPIGFHRSAIFGVSMKEDMFAENSPPKRNIEKTSRTEKTIYYESTVQIPKKSQVQDPEKKGLNTSSFSRGSKMGSPHWHLKGWPSRCRRGSPPWWRSVPSPSTPCPASWRWGGRLGRPGTFGRLEESQNPVGNPVEIHGKSMGNPVESWCLKKKTTSKRFMMMSMKRNDEKPAGFFSGKPIFRETQYNMERLLQIYENLETFQPAKGRSASGY